ncbi:MAG TPA: ABC transporter substrate-binding protein [Acidimicrobiales bacterium]|nr:ABC transporter substrate-binding protein [Acidimicrobiales bacterium]
MHIRHGRLVAAAALALGVVAFGPISSATASSSHHAAAVAAVHHGGSLVDLVNGGEWPGLDPATNTQDTADATENNAIFGQLFEVGPNGTIVPSMASGYHLADHNLKVLISIRPGQKFQDGTPFNAQAVAQSIQRDLLPANACLCLPNFKAVTSIAAQGKYTVVLTLSSPFSPIIPAFVNEAPNWVTSPTALARMGEAAYAQHPVGAGPFEVVSNSASSQLVLKRYPGYWQKGRPYLNSLTFTSTGNDQTDLSSIQAGQAQYSIVTTIPIFQQAKSTAGLTTYRLPAILIQFVALNNNLPPFNNPTARLALAYATNPKSLVANLYGHIYTPVQGYTGPGQLFYQPKVSDYPAYNLTKAKALVQQLGGLTITLDTTTNTQFWITEAEALQSMWGQAGIKVNVKIDSLQNLLGLIASRNWQAISSNWGNSIDPAIDLPIYFASYGNFSGIKDPTLDGLMNQGAAFASAPTRARVYAKVNQQMNKTAEAIFEYAKPVLIVTRSNVQGVANGTPVVDWENVWMK